MRSRDFVYWFQGFLELAKPKVIESEQVQVIQNHINMVFVEEIDPSFGAEKQEALDAAHNGDYIAPQRTVHPHSNAGLFGGKPRFRHGDSDQEVIYKC